MERPERPSRHQLEEQNLPTVPERPPRLLEGRPDSFLSSRRQDPCSAGPSTFRDVLLTRSIANTCDSVERPDAVITERRLHHLLEEYRPEKRHGVVWCLHLATRGPSNDCIVKIELTFFKYKYECSLIAVEMPEAVITDASLATYWRNIALRSRHEYRQVERPEAVITERQPHHPLEEYRPERPSRHGTVSTSGQQMKRVHFVDTLDSDSDSDERLTSYADSADQTDHSPLLPDPVASSSMFSSMIPDPVLRRSSLYPMPQMRTRIQNSRSFAKRLRLAAAAANSPYNQFIRMQDMHQGECSTAPIESSPPSSPTTEDMVFTPTRRQMNFSPPPIPPFPPPRNLLVPVSATDDPVSVYRAMDTTQSSANPGDGGGVADGDVTEINQSDERSNAFCVSHRGRIRVLDAFDLMRRASPLLYVDRETEGASTSNNAPTQAVRDEEQEEVIEELEALVSLEDRQRSASAPLLRPNFAAVESVRFIGSPEFPGPNQAESPEYPRPEPRSPEPASAEPRSPNPSISEERPANPSSPPTKELVGVECQDDQMEELNLSIVSLFECPVCMEYMGPPIYQCLQGHLVCAACKPRLYMCPTCRSRFTETRNLGMEKVADKLKYPCKNSMTGCQESFRLKDKQNHEQGCGFRHYACIVANCAWKGYKPELVVHMTTLHRDKVLIGCCQALLVSLQPTAFNTWVVSAHNEVFKVVFCSISPTTLGGCVIFIGSPDKAKDYRYSFILTGRTSAPVYRKRVFTRSTHSEAEPMPNPRLVKDIMTIDLDDANHFKEQGSLLSVGVYIEESPV